MRLYGRDWTRREFEARVGRIGQIGGLRRMTLSEGPEAGTELIEVRTGTGLRYCVHPSKGLDIGLAEWKGVPISWQGPSGDVHPSYYDPEGTEWLRTASGGLLMTCGLSHMGSPGVDEAGKHGLHGRIHHTPASQVSATTEWEGDELNYRISGTLEEFSLFGTKLRLRRVIAGRLGEDRIVIEDRIENAGFKDAPLRMLYHFNFGFPLLSGSTRLVFPEADVWPAVKGTPLEGYDRWSEPDPLTTERVYLHRLKETGIGEGRTAETAIASPDFPAGPVTVTLRWSADRLPYLVQWRMPGAGEHVLGLEPATRGFEGREAEKAAGGPVLVPPGEAVLHRLELNIVPGA